MTATRPQPAPARVCRQASSVFGKQFAFQPLPRCGFAIRKQIEVLHASTCRGRQTGLAGKSLHMLTPPLKPLSKSFGPHHGVLGKRIRPACAVGEIDSRDPPEIAAVKRPVRLNRIELTHRGSELVARLIGVDDILKTAGEAFRRRHRGQAQAFSGPASLLDVVLDPAIKRAMTPRKPEPEHLAPRVRVLSMRSNQRSSTANSGGWPASRLPPWAV